MPIPAYQTLMLPVLTALSDGEPQTAAAVRDRVAEAIGLTGEDRGERIPSGSRVFDSRVHWSVTYMVQAGLLERPRARRRCPHRPRTSGLAGQPQSR